MVCNTDYIYLPIQNIVFIDPRIPNTNDKTIGTNKYILKKVPHAVLEQNIPMTSLHIECEILSNDSKEY